MRLPLLVLSVPPANVAIWGAHLMDYQLARRAAARFAAIAVMLMTGACASSGKDFQRPDPNSLVLGQTTLSEVLTKFGPPLSQTTSSSDTSTGTPSRSQENRPAGLRRASVPGQIESLRYQYAHAALEGGGAIARVRQFTLAFWNGRLVQYNYSSSFENDSTNFDPAKVSSFTRGQTTKAQALSALGQPGGQAIYPAVAKEGTSELMYQYVVTGPRQAETTIKNLELLFDASDRLQEVLLLNEVRSGTRTGN